MTSSNLAVFPVHLTSRTFKRHECLPQWSDALWKIEQGVVRTLTWTEEGHIIGLGYWGPGDLIGQPLSKLDPYQVECITPVTARLIPPSIWSSELNGILSYTQQAQELHSIVQCQKTDQRLLKFLAWLANKFGRIIETGTLIDLRLTHIEISEVIGTTRVSVTRVIQKLEDQGKILRPRRHYIVLANSQRYRD